MVNKMTQNTKEALDGRLYNLIKYIPASPAKVFFDKISDGEEWKHLTEIYGWVFKGSRSDQVGQIKKLKRELGGK